MRSLLYLLLPTVVVGKIAVFISLSTDPPIFDVHGHSSDLVTDPQRKEFKIEDAQLKAAVATYSNQTPTDVFVNQDTRFGNLHEKYGWFTIKASVRAKVKSVDDKKCTVTPWNTKKGYVIALNTYDVVNDAFLNENISYKIDYDNGAFEFDSVVGLNKKSEERFPVEFAPTNITKCEITAILEYETKLTGDVVVNYSNKRDGHYFWAYNIVKLQGITGLPKAVVRHETIKIRYGKPMRNATMGSTTPRPV